MKALRIVSFIWMVAVGLGLTSYLIHNIAADFSTTQMVKFGAICLVVVLSAAAIAIVYKWSRE